MKIKSVNSSKGVLVLLILFVILAVGCSQSETEENNNENNTGEGATPAEERIITDGMGNEVTIPANPERILASYLEDYLVALDIAPVAQWSVRDGSSIQDYLQDYLDGIPLVPHDLPFEVVTDYDPDLLLIRDAVDQATYDQYARITSTYVMEAKPENWREMFSEIGKVLGMEDKVQTVLDEYDTKAEEAATALNEAETGNSAAAVWLIGTSHFIVTEQRSSGAVMYGDLQLEPPSVLSRLDDDADWVAISLEELVQLDVDHLFLINSTESGISTILEDSLWQNIPAVENGNVYEFGPETSWLYHGPKANEQIIDHILDSILE